MTARAALASLLAATTCAACGSGVTVGGSPGAASSADSPSAALTFSSVPAPGKACTTNDDLSFPATGDLSVVAELNCDLSMGCRPNEHVVVDREQGASVSCTVAPSGDRFDVRLTLDVDGSATSGPSIRFSADGLVSRTSGNVAVTESNDVSGAGSEPDCTLTIEPPYGFIGKGKLWANFECSAFRDEDLADSGCDLRGKLLFMNCDG